jgi:hypothetical protein
MDSTRLRFTQKRCAASSPRSCTFHACLPGREKTKRRQCSAALYGRSRYAKALAVELANPPHFRPKSSAAGCAYCRSTSRRVTVPPGERRCRRFLDEPAGALVWGPQGPDPRDRHEVLFANFKLGTLERRTLRRASQVRFPLGIATGRPPTHDSPPHASENEAIVQPQARHTLTPRQRNRAQAISIRSDNQCLW